jgi:hypothetical protein
MRRSIVTTATALVMALGLTQAAAGSPNVAASCQGLEAQFASQFGAANGHITAEAAQGGELGRTISASAARHLGTYQACIGG